ncbi:MAG: ABC transporter substrate-binding protein [Actinobacteria bacterium]|jgi:peptide/nickel transport system substrate-binding protein|nr:ABC transporter substrate-binding protein [Actinomycetota bacterium]NDF57060.1 ABC transporter substrate-binding protein [Actinomycetota bacterium]
MGYENQQLLGGVQMRLKKKGLALAGALTLGASVIVSITSAEAATPASWIGPVPAKPGATKGGTVTLYNQADFEHLDPARNYVGGTLDFYRLFIRTLTQYRTVNGKTELVPDVAADLGTTNDGGLSWTFKLKTNLKYEDGSTITCEDLKYGTMRSYNDDILDGGTTYAKDFIDNPTNYKGPYTEPNADLYGVQCSPKGDEITYVLTQPIPYFPYVTTFGSFSPVPKSKDTKQNYDNRPFSSGPYKIESYDRNKQLTLVRNSYWDPKTDPIRWNYPDKFVVKMGADQNVIEQTLISDSGEAKTYVSTDTNIVTNLSKVLGKPAYKDRLFSFLSPYNRYYAINVNTVKDLNVRKAIQCAIDFKTVLAAAGGTNAGQYANSTIPPSIKGAYRNFPVCERDVIKNPEAQTAKAKAYLAKAKDKKTTLRLAYRDRGVEPLRAAAVEQALKAAGFTVIMDKYPPAGYYSVVSKRGVPKEPDIVQTSWAFDWSAASGIVYALFDGRTMTSSDAHSNYSRGNFSDIQKLFEKADQSAPAVQEKILGDIEQNLITEKAAHLSVYFERSHMMSGSKLGGIQVDNGWGDLSVLGAYVKK